MSIKVLTSNPRDLKDQINKYIVDGRISTWEVDADGDYTHSPEQWKNQAWFKIHYTQDGMVLGIWPPSNKNISIEIYAVYHGRFSEMLLSHFDSEFSKIIISSMPTEYDRIEPISR